MPDSGASEKLIRRVMLEERRRCDGDLVRALAATAYRTGVDVWRVSSVTGTPVPYDSRWSMADALRSGHMRVPREQGDGGACLDKITAALDAR